MFIKNQIDQQIVFRKIFPKSYISQKKSYIKT